MEETRPAAEQADGGRLKRQSSALPIWRRGLEQCLRAMRAVIDTEYDAQALRPLVDAADQAFAGAQRWGPWPCPICDDDSDTDLGKPCTDCAAKGGVR